MIRHKRIDFICALAVASALLVTVVMITGIYSGGVTGAHGKTYADMLFDENVVHTIDIRISPELWEEMLDSAPDEEYFHCGVVVNGEAFNNIAIRLKGHSSKDFLSEFGYRRFDMKLSFNHYISGLSYHGLDKITLHGGYLDNTYLKDFFVFDMMRKAGVASPLTSYVWLTVNGEDCGLYLAIEDMRAAFLRRNFGRDIGKLYKPEYTYRNDENNDVALIYTDDDFTSYSGIFDEAMTNITAIDKKRLIDSLRILSGGEDLETAVDIEPVLTYFAVLSYIVNLDSYLGDTGHNYYLYEKNGILSMFPWDNHQAFATYSVNVSDWEIEPTKYVNYPIDTPYWRVEAQRRPMLSKLLEHEVYLQLYRQIYSDFIVSYFESGYFDERMDTVVSMISPYVERDPTRYLEYEMFLRSVDTFREFNRLRVMSVRGQLEGSIPSTFEGQVENPDALVNADHVWLPYLGDLDYYDYYYG